MRPKGCDCKLAGVFVRCFQVTLRSTKHDDVIELNSRRVFAASRWQINRGCWRVCPGSSYWRGTRIRCEREKGSSMFCDAR